MIKPETNIIFLSGPMSGLPEYNYPEFKRVAKLLRDKGFKVIDPSETGVHEGWGWKDYMICSMVDLLTNDVDTVVLLDGWEDSEGAKLEVHMANKLEMKVISLQEFLSSLEK